MNFETTSNILEALKPYIGNSNIIIVDENISDKQNYVSDVVKIDEKNNVGFEVTDNEIIASFFSEHEHFEDYSCDLKEDDPNYIERAKAFLIDLFSIVIKNIKIFKGSYLIKEKYVLLYTNKEEKCTTIVYADKFLICLVPFLTKRVEEKSWLYDKDKGRFVEV